MKAAESHKHSISALAQDHEEIRDGLARATREPGLLGEAASRVPQLCLQHFDVEERSVFPAFAIIHEVILENLDPEKVRILPLIEQFNRAHDVLARQHKAMAAAIEALWQAAYEEGNEEIAEFARRLRNHERLESEVLYPTVLMIGKFLQELTPAPLVDRA